jgi:hypothetical protein
VLAAGTVVDGSSGDDAGVVEMGDVDDAVVVTGGGGTVGSVATGATVVGIAEPTGALEAGPADPPLSQADSTVVRPIVTASQRCLRRSTRALSPTRAWSADVSFTSPP